MSDRQLARAATSGRSLTFTFHTGEPLVGYLVGSDDFHWLVAHKEDEDPTVTLVHKATAPRVKIAPNPTLPTENEEFQKVVAQIGEGFWKFCTETYLGRKA